MLDCVTYVKLCQTVLEIIKNARNTPLSLARTLELAELENFYTMELEDSLDWLSQVSD